LIKNKLGALSSLKSYYKPKRVFSLWTTKALNVPSSFERLLLT